MKKYLPSIIFNLAETILIILTSLIIGVKFAEIITVIFIFALSRLFIGGGKHYKSPVKCMIWSLIVITSLAIVFQLGLDIGILFIVLATFIGSSKADAKDIYMYSPHVEAKHKINEIKTKSEFEKLLDKCILSAEEKKLLKLRYIDKLSLNEIAEKLNIEYETAKKHHKKAVNIIAPELAFY